MDTRNLSCNMLCSKITVSIYSDIGETRNTVKNQNNLERNSLDEKERKLIMTTILKKGGVGLTIKIYRMCDV